MLSEESDLHHLTNRNSLSIQNIHASQTSHFNNAKTEERDMKHELTLAAVLVAAVSGQVTAQTTDPQAELRAVRAELSRVEAELKKAAACATRTQTLDATLQRRVVWMPESQARAMGLQLWTDANGNTPRIPITAAAPVTGASAFSQSAPIMQSTVGALAAPTTVLQSQPVAGSVLSSAPIQTYAAPLQNYAAPLQTYSAPIQTYSAPVQTFGTGGIVNYATPSFGYATSAGAGFVQSTAALGMDNNPHLQEKLPYHRESWVARSHRQAYETVQYRGTAADTTPHGGHPYVVYPYHARWAFRR
jgi:hypothetical protein